MRDKPYHPPRLALWLLRQAGQGKNQDALVGDLLERFREGQTKTWFWRQALIACAFGVLPQIQSYGPHLGYALAGAGLSAYFWNTLKDVPGFLHWWLLPWPFSQLVLELSRDILLALAALSVLAIGLVIRGPFRWGDLVRTGAISVALIMVAHYSLDVCPWLLRPIPGAPSHIRRLIIPAAVGMPLSFASFLFSAWLGCRLPRPPTQASTIAANLIV